MVFVLNKNKKPLDPCHESVARKLLKDGKAVVHKKYPFTIRLKELKTTESNSNFRLKNQLELHIKRVDEFYLLLAQKSVNA